jgi:hypothetical protein
MPEGVITTEQLEELVEAVQPLKKKKWLAPLVTLMEEGMKHVIDLEERIVTLED